MSRTHTSIKGLKAGDVIGAIDLGSSKVACLIARLGSDGVPRIMGFGHQVSQGVRGGVIVDLEKVERDIRQTVATAEQMAGETIRDCIVGISGGLHSRLLSFDLDIAGHEIADRDLARVERHPVLAQAITPDQALLHRLVVAYRIDGCRSVKDPRGMFGERLTVNMHLLTVADGALRTLDTAVERSHLSPVLHVAQPHAAALGALTPDEIQLGVTVIDMGAETTSLALFLDGELVHADVLGLGGGHVTRDIAQGLNTPLDHAERMKTLWGSVIKAESDNREILRVPQIGSEVSGEPEVEMPRSMLTAIIRPRLEETFELLRDRLANAGLRRGMGRAVVLTGGASQLTGLRDLAGQMLDKQVRVARPRPLPGLPEAASGSAFAGAVGLIRAAGDAKLAPPPPISIPFLEQGRSDSAVLRLGRWLRDNFWN